MCLLLDSSQERHDLQPWTKRGRKKVEGERERDRERRKDVTKRRGRKVKRKNLVFVSFLPSFFLLLWSDPILRFCCFTTGSYLRRERRRRARMERELLLGILWRKEGCSARRMIFVRERDPFLFFVDFAG